MKIHKFPCVRHWLRKPQWQRPLTKMLCSVNNNSFIIPPAPLGQRKVADGPGEEQMLALPSPKRNRAPPLWASGRGAALPNLRFLYKQRKIQATNLKIGKSEVSYWNAVPGLSSQPHHLCCFISYIYSSAFPFYRKNSHMKTCKINSLLIKSLGEGEQSLKVKNL